jgi:hypothetical protein
MKTTLDNDIENALRFDSLAEAEKLAGKDYKTDESVVWLGMGLMQNHNEKKDALLTITDDTRWGLSCPDYISCCERMGFTLEYSEPSNEGNSIYLMWHPDGILLFFESYFAGKSINSAKAYFNAFYGDGRGLDGCSHGPIGDTDGKHMRDGSYDAREGLRNRLKAIREDGGFISPWVKAPFMWLLNYEETKIKDVNYRNISKSRISKLRPEIQACIGQLPN